MDTDRDKNVSCFTLDGVVAEMVIEVEDSQKPGFDDFKDLSTSPSKNERLSDEDIDSENKVDNAEIADMEVFHCEKKEDKENIIDIPEISHDIKDYKNESNNSNQTTKKERKRKYELSHDENEKGLDLPRYPGEKKRKLSADSKDVKREKITPSSKKKSSRNGKEESDLSVMESNSTKEVLTVHAMKDELDNVEKECFPKVDNEFETIESKSKQKTLRKLPFRKNEDTPDVPDLKPKVFWWNGVGAGMGIKLGDLPEVREQIKKAKSVRALYRVLFFQWPTNGQDLISEILNFNGFPFNKSSYEFTKRESLMKIMLDITISNICDTLGVKKGHSKAVMINNILNFLLKPTLDRSMQPVVKLQRIVLDDTYFQTVSENVKSSKISGSAKIKVSNTKKSEKSPINSSVMPMRATRNSMSRMKTVETPINKKIPAKATDSLKASSAKSKLSSSKQADSSVSKNMSKGKMTLVKDTKVSKGDKSTTQEKTKSDDAVQKSGNECLQNDAPNKINTVKKLKKKKKKMGKSLSKHKAKKLLDKEPIQKPVELDIEMEIESKSPVEKSVERSDELSKSALMEEKMKEGVEKESKLDLNAVKESTVILSDSSETESAEETKLVSASAAIKTSTVKSPQKRKGRPLRTFPKISDSIKKANFSALQRLHILLFGASDKAENLKGNILAFGGFPFLEGSDEWKQKHFLLSLLAQNNLREYLKLLCIEYSDDDQPTMINKLMKFLAAPSENTDESKSVIEREVVPSEQTKKETLTIHKKSKLEAKKKNVKKKKEEKKPNARNRKILMSEEEARRLEASFAREQRALARDIRAPPPITRQPAVADTRPIPTTMKKLVVTSKIPKSPITDPSQLNALLQTVYKRRALKAAGAVISTPNKGEKIRLGAIENIKFLVVTSNLKDLEVLHQLIYMLPASKSRLRKNILDFDGFGFNEDSNKYKERMDLLNNLGYDISKRLSFLLGLCPLQTDIPQQDLNELIMYFLMSPCKNKQVVPITQMPVDTIGLPEEHHVILKPSLEVDKSTLSQAIFQAVHESPPTPIVPEISIQSTPVYSGMRQKAKKSFSSGVKLSPVKKILLPPASSSMTRMLNFSPKQSIGNISSSVAMFNPIHTLPTYSLPKTTVHNTGTSVSLFNNSGNVAVLNASKSPSVNTVIKLPVVNPVSKVQLMNPSPKAAVLDAATKIPISSMSHIAGQIIQNPVIFPNVSGKVGIHPQQNVVSTPVGPGSKMLVRTPSVISSPQEFLVQQQTPDGQQKTFKLIRLPSNHPLASAVKPPVQQAVSTPHVQQPVVTTGIPPFKEITLPPGIVVMKNSPALQLPGQNMQNILQTVPLKINIPVNKCISSVITTPLPNDADEFVLPDQGESVDTSGNDPDVEILNPLEDNPPTDEELFSSIQEIILSSNFEDITLRNVIDRVSAQFPHHDLTHRHNFMKECVKKIIIGT